MQSQRLLHAHRATMPYVSALDDYLPCPALSHWLPQRLAGRRVAGLVAAGAPARLRRWLSRVPDASVLAWSEWVAGAEADGERGRRPPTASRFDAWVLVGSLRRPLPAGLAGLIAPGSVVVDASAVGGLRVGERLFGIPARRSVHRVTAGRLVQWQRWGLGDVEQWLTTEPADTFVTTGIRRAPPALRD